MCGATLPRLRLLKLALNGPCSRITKHSNGCCAGLTPASLFTRTSSPGTLYAYSFVNLLYLNMRFPSILEALHRRAQLHGAWLAGSTQAGFPVRFNFVSVFLHSGKWSQFPHNLTALFQLTHSVSNTPGTCRGLCNQNRRLSSHLEKAEHRLLQERDTLLFFASNAMDLSPEVLRNPDVVQVLAFCFLTRRFVRRDLVLRVVIMPQHGVHLVFQFTFDSLSRLFAADHMIEGESAEQVFCYGVYGFLLSFGYQAILSIDIVYCPKHNITQKASFR